jgi:anti-sigma regulatory factor (Ser/Thr protein kinase)
LIRVPRAVPVQEATQVAEARRITTQCAERMKLGATATGRAALVATELATNLVKHAKGGSILIGSDDDTGALILIAIDKGSGIPNVQAALRDGYSTGGSPGTGLGAIRRSSSEFDIYVGKGTAVFCRIDSDTYRPPLAIGHPSRITIGGICTPKHQDDDPGDAWIAVVGREMVTVTVADGLGHGTAASTASLGVVRVVRERPEAELDEIFRVAHGALRTTRGAAVGIARIHLAAGRVDFSGVGNIAATIAADDTARKVVSLPGIVGHEMRKTQTFSYPWTAASLLVVQSDGVSASWNLDHYPGLAQRDAALIAAVLHRDFCRGSDDATVVVAKAS